MSWQQVTMIWQRIPFKRLNILDIWLKRDHLCKKGTIAKKALAELVPINVDLIKKNKIPQIARIASETNVKQRTKDTETYFFIIYWHLTKLDLSDKIKSFQIKTEDGFKIVTRQDAAASLSSSSTVDLI